MIIEPANCVVIFSSIIGCPKNFKAPHQVHLLKSGISPVAVLRVFAAAPYKCRIFYSSYEIHGLGCFFACICQTMPGSMHYFAVL
jgi:hypothetical protein